MMIGSQIHFLIDFIIFVSIEKETSIEEPIYRLPSIVHTFDRMLMMI